MFQKHLITFCAIVFALATFFYSPEPAIAAPSSPAGGGTLVEPVDITPFGKTRSPGSERVENAIDNNDQSKFLNFHKTGSGFTVTFDKAVVVNEIEFTTANDDHGRDPIEVEISGSNQSPQSGFSKIADVPLTKIRKRFAPYGNGFTNGTAYKYYRVVITDVDNRRRANSFQFAEVDFYSTGTPPMGAEPGGPPTGAPGMPPTDMPPMTPPPGAPGMPPGAENMVHCSGADRLPSDIDRTHMSQKGCDMWGGKWNGPPGAENMGHCSGEMSRIPHGIQADELSQAGCNWWGGKWNGPPGAP